MTFEQAADNIIFYDDQIIGFSWDVARYLDYEFNELPEEERDEEAQEEVFSLLEEADGLVKCWFHPMGSWVVNRLVEDKK